MMLAQMSVLTILSLDIIITEQHTTITRVKVISSMEHFIKKINHCIFPCGLVFFRVCFRTKNAVCVAVTILPFSGLNTTILSSFTALRDHIFSVLNMKCIVIIICEANSLVIHSIRYCNTLGCLNLDNH